MPSGDRLSLAALWGEIQRGVAERRSTAELWQIANEAAQARGFTGLTGGIQAMNSLRATASAIRDAAARFAAASPTALLTTDYIAPDINAQSILGRSLTPVYRVRFLHTVQTVGGEQVGAHRTVSFPFQLPLTKQALIEELALNALSLAETYGEESIGVDEIQITVV